MLANFGGPHLRPLGLQQRLLELRGAAGCPGGQTQSPAVTAFAQLTSSKWFCMGVPDSSTLRLQARLSNACSHNKLSHSARPRQLTTSELHVHM